MRVFVTGAAGWVGSRVTAELIAHGHTVLGLSRSAANASKLQSLGAQVHDGDLTNLESIKKGAEQCDAVIHCGFVHDFSRFAEILKIDHDVTECIGNTLAGTNKPFLVTGGVYTLGTHERPGEETDDISKNPHPRRANEELALSFVAKGVRVNPISLPPSVHGKGDQGFVPTLVNAARKFKVSGYASEDNLWPTVHVNDAAVVYRLVLEKGKAGERFHAVAEQDVKVKDIAMVIGEGLKVPVEKQSQAVLQEHLGMLATFSSMNVPTSSKITREKLGWAPKSIELLADIKQNYLDEVTPTKYGVADANGESEKKQ